MADTATLEVKIQAVVDGLASIGDLTAKIAETVGGLKSFDEAAASAVQNLKNLSDAHEAGAKHAKDDADAQSSLIEQLKKIVEGTTQGAEAVKHLGERLLEITGIATLVGTVLASISIEHFFEKGIEGATSFEDAMIRLSVASGKTVEDLAAIGEKASEIGAKLGFESGESVAGLTQLTSSIGDVDQALSALQPTLELARVTNLGVAEAATVVTTALAQYKLAGEDAQEVTDIFVATSQQAGISISELVRQFTLVGPSASQAGLSIRETGVILAAVADTGLRGRQAYSALIEVFSQLGDAGSNFRQSLLGVGITSDNLGTVFQQLAKKGDAAGTVLTAFSPRVQTALRALLQNGGASLDALTKKLSSVGGTSAQAAALIESSFTQTAKRLGIAFFNLAESLVLPTLGPLAEELDKIKGKFEEFAKTQAFEDLKKSILDFVVNVIAAFNRFAESIGEEGVANAVTKLSQGISDLSGACATCRENFNTLSTVVSVFLDVITAGFRVVQGIADHLVAAVSGSILRVFVAARAAAKLFGKDTTELDAKIIALSETIADLQKDASTHFDQAGKAIQHVSDNVNDLGGAAEKAKPKLTELGKAAEDAGKGAEKLKTSTDSIVDALNLIPASAPNFNAVTGQIENLGTAALEAGPGLSSMAADISAQAAQLPALQAELAATGAELATLAANGQGTSKAFEDLTAKYQETQAKIDALKGSTTGLTDRQRELVLQLENQQKALADLKAHGLDPTGRASDELERSIGELQAKINAFNTKDAERAATELEAAFTALGVKSGAELTRLASTAKENFEKIRDASGTSVEGLNQASRAFEAYAKVQLASLADATDATRADEEAKLREQAAILGDLDAVNLIIDGYNASANAADHAADSTDKLNKKRREAPPPPPGGGGGGGGGNGAGVGGGGGLIDPLAENNLQNLADAAKHAADDIKSEVDDAIEYGQRASGALNDLLNVEAGFLTQFAGHSQKAVDTFGHVLVEFFNGAHAFTQQAIADGTGISRFGEALAAAGQFVQDSITQQQVGVAELGAQYQNMSDKAVAALLKGKVNADALIASLQGDAAAAREGHSAFDLLGASDLGPLAAGLDAIAAKVRAVKDQADQATASIKGLISSTQDEIDSLLGNDQAIEQRRHQAALDNIEELRKAGADNEQIQKAIKEENILHGLKMQHIKDQQQANEDAQAQQAAQDAKNIQDQKDAQKQADDAAQKSADDQLDTEKKITKTVIARFGGGGVVGALATAGQTIPGGGPNAIGPNGGVASPVQVTVNIDNALGTEEQLADTLTRRIGRNLTALGVLSR